MAYAVPTTGTDTNQQQGQAGGLGGAAQSLGLASSFQANAPNQGAYGAITNNTGQQAQNFYGLGASAMGQAAPTIANPHQAQDRSQLGNVNAGIGGLAGTLQGDITDPNQSIAVHQFQQGLDQSINAQQAAANSARGGGVAMAAPLAKRHT